MHNIVHASSVVSSGEGGGGSIAPLIVMLIVGVLMIASWWKIFTKAGKPGWAAIVPIYNLIVMLDIAGKPAWWIVLFLIPFVSIIAYILLLVGICNAFGKGGGYVAGMIFLGVIFVPMLAFGSAQYQGARA